MTVKQAGETLRHTKWQSAKCTAKKLFGARGLRRENNIEMNRNGTVRYPVEYWIALAHGYGPVAGSS
jgi:hypothetical protein